MKVTELQEGMLVRRAGSAHHTRWETVWRVQESSRDPKLVEVYFRGKGGRWLLVPANAEYEIRQASLPVLKSRRETIDTYDLSEAVEVKVLRGRGPETVPTNCIRVTCKDGKNEVMVWGPKPGGISGWLTLTEAEEDRILDGLGVKR